VEARYGAAGTSFKETMKRIFKNVPHIYGFSSVGPSGKTIEPFLENYLKSIPDYEKHLADQEAKRAVTLINNYESFSHEKNEIFNKVMKATAFTECSGFLSNGDDPIMDNICYLRDESKDLNDRLNYLAGLLGTKEFLTYIPLGQELIKNAIDYGEDYQSGLDSIRNNQAFKSQFMGLVDRLPTAFSKLQYAKFSLLLDWISKDKFKQMEKDVLLDRLKHPVATANKDAICSYAYDQGEYNQETEEYEEVKTRITFADIDKRILHTRNGLEAIECLNAYDKETSKYIHNRLPYYGGLTKLLAYVLMAKGDPKNKTYYYNLKSKFKTAGLFEKGVLVGAISEMKNVEDSLIDQIIKGYSDNRKVKIPEVGVSIPYSEFISNYMYSLFDNNPEYSNYKALLKYYNTSNLNVLSNVSDFLAKLRNISFQERQDILAMAKGFSVEEFKSQESPKEFRDELISDAYKGFKNVDLTKEQLYLISDELIELNDTWSFQEIWEIKIAESPAYYTKLFRYEFENKYNSSLLYQSKNITDEVISHSLLAASQMLQNGETEMVERLFYNLSHKDKISNELAGNLYTFIKESSDKLNYQSKQSVFELLEAISDHDDQSKLYFMKSIGQFGGSFIWNELDTFVRNELKGSEMNAEIADELIHLANLRLSQDIYLSEDINILLAEHSKNNPRFLEKLNGQKAKEAIEYYKK